MGKLRSNLYTFDSVPMFYHFIAWLWGSYGFLMGKLWGSHGFIVILWGSYGFLMGKLWVSYGEVMGFYKIIFQHN